MIPFLLQLQGSVASLRVHYSVLFLFFVWGLWLIKFAVSRFYRNHANCFHGMVSVIVPVVDESPEFFAQVLQRITSQQPHELIVVINGPRNEPLEQVCDNYPGLQRIWLQKAGKRNAIAEGVRRATGEIVVLVDSDSLWQPNALSELLKPFTDPKIGGTTIEQRIWEPRRSLWTRFADWMEEMRGSYGLPAMSVFRNVGCLPGRTVAFRRGIVLNALPDFLSERFLGTHLEISDDRTLTNHCLRQGYGAVVQRSGLLLTDAPTTFAGFVRQQLRWARGSQYNTLKMLPWMLRHARFLSLVYIGDLVMPFFFMGVLFNIAWQFASGSEFQWTNLTVLEHTVLAVAGGTAGLMVKRLSRLRDYPEEILFLPVYWVLVSCLLAPIRIWGFVRMAYDRGWRTRSNAYPGTESHSPLRLVPAGIALALLAIFAILGRLIEHWQVCSTSIP